MPTVIGGNTPTRAYIKIKLTKRVMFYLSLQKTKQPNLYPSYKATSIQ
ncbi:hypothetical protein BVRB_1g022160 [Beta vulgaris subsp. vulgaris]|nr:hypothetical protein BVRB_1g022160 [Beta vulgaris subsp. vulgaris]